MSTTTFDSFISSGNVLVVDMDKFESSNKTTTSTTSTNEKKSIDKLKTKIKENFDDAIGIAGNVINLRKNRERRNERRGKKTNLFLD
jgi:hypothetical protein